MPRKRVGQHFVQAIIAYAGPLGFIRLNEAFGDENVIGICDEHVKLAHVSWTPTPSRNEWNTESDFRKKLRDCMKDCIYDVILPEYKWEPIESD
jgi:hypothetical protein